MDNHNGDDERQQQERLLKALLATKNKNKVSAMNKLETLLGTERPSIDKEGKKYDANMKLREAEFAAASEQEEVATERLRLFSAPPISAPTVKLTKLPPLADLIPFNIRAHDTTPRDIKVFFTAFEAACRIAGIPFKEQGRFRHYDMLHLSFQKGTKGRTLDAATIRWLTDQQTKGDWADLKKQFELRYVHDTTSTTAVMRLNSFRQTELMTAADFSDEYVERVKEAHFPAAEPDADWMASRPDLGDLFLQKLLPTIKNEIVRYQPQFAKDPRNLAKLIGWAKEAERSLTLVRSYTKSWDANYTARDGNEAKRDAKRDKGRKKAKRADDERDDGATHGDKRYKDRALCTRCGKQHQNGASSCWAMRHADGHTLDASSATAPVPSRIKAFEGQTVHLKKCYNCGSTTHTRASCPTNNQSKTIKRLQLQLKQANGNNKRGHGGGGPVQKKGKRLRFTQGQCHTDDEAGDDEEDSDASQ
jgi:hypothetical protein